MPDAGTLQTSHPLDIRSSLRQACDQADVRRAGLYLSLLIDSLAEEDKRRSGSALLPRLDTLEKHLAAGGLTEGHLAERDRLIEDVRAVLEWTIAPVAHRTALPVLRMRAVCRSFQSSSFGLKDIHLDVGVQEIVGIVGLNASGKSTLLRIAASRLRQDSGEVSYPAIEAERPQPSTLTKIAYVAQEPEPWAGRLHEHLTLLLAFHGITGKENTAACRDILDDFKIRDLAERRWHELSGGARARCALAIAFAPKPRLIVLDEPMAYLDPGSRRWFLDRLYQLAHDPRHGAAILVSSHLVPELEAVARVLLLEEGALISPGAQPSGAGMVIDLVSNRPWRTSEILQRSLELGPNQLRVEARPDPRQVRVTLPPGVHRGAVLRVLAEHGITPIRFADLTDSAARRL
jgi:ABC-2 type transport system ATP-binding protein